MIRITLLCLLLCFLPACDQLVKGKQVKQKNKKQNWQANLNAAGQKVNNLTNNISEQQQQFFLYHNKQRKIITTSLSQAQRALQKNQATFDKMLRDRDKRYRQASKLHSTGKLDSGNRPPSATEEAAIKSKLAKQKKKISQSKRTLKFLNAALKELNLYLKKVQAFTDKDGETFLLKQQQGTIDSLISKAANTDKNSRRI